VPSCLAWSPLQHATHVAWSGQYQLATASCSPLPSTPAAEAAGRQNIAFICHFLLGRLDACIDLLVGCGRLPEAAFFARTYAPSRMTEVRRLSPPLERIPRGGTNRCSVQEAGSCLSRQESSRWC
jgi:hypothetical protein